MQRLRKSRLGLQSSISDIGLLDSQIIFLFIFRNLGPGGDEGRNSFSLYTILYVIYLMV